MTPPATTPEGQQCLFMRVDIYVGQAEAAERQNPGGPPVGTETLVPGKWHKSSWTSIAEFHAHIKKRDKYLEGGITLHPDGMEEQCDWRRLRVYLAEEATDG